jgi:hypothetical protein
MVEEPIARSREQVLQSQRRRLLGVDLRSRAAELGADYDSRTDELVVAIMDRELRIDSELRVRATQGAVDYEEEVILLNALLGPGSAGGDTGPRAGNPALVRGGAWVPFREMAGGHAGDFRAEVEAPLAEAASRVVPVGEAVARAIGGRVTEPLGGSDLALEVRLFPGVDALVQLYLADMEFPADARVLFSAGADRYLPPGCLEELGHRLVERILAAVED